jgi:hypothetical protein
MQDSKDSQPVDDIEKNAEQPTISSMNMNAASENEPFSIYTRNQKRLMVVFAAVAAFFSPLTANIYLPALNTLANDLNVSNSKITLTVTTYLVCTES